MQYAEHATALYVCCSSISYMNKCLVKLVMLMMLVSTSHQQDKHDCIMNLEGFPGNRQNSPVQICSDLAIALVGGYKLNLGTGPQSSLPGHSIHSTRYSRTCLERPPHWPQKCGLSRQVVSRDTGSDIFKYRSFSKNVWFVKTGGPSWQWSLKTGFIVHVLCLI